MFPELTVAVTLSPLPQRHRRGGGILSSALSQVKHRGVPGGQSGRGWRRAAAEGDDLSLSRALRKATTETLKSYKCSELAVPPSDHWTIVIGAGSHVVGLRPQIRVLRAARAAAEEHVHPPRQGGPVQAGDGPEAGQGRLPLPAEPQQRPGEASRGEQTRQSKSFILNSCSSKVVFYQTTADFEFEFLVILH